MFCCCWLQLHCFQIDFPDVVECWTTLNCWVQRWNSNKITQYCVQYTIVKLAFICCWIYVLEKLCMIAWCFRGARARPRWNGMKYFHSIFHRARVFCEPSSSTSTSRKLRRSNNWLYERVASFTSFPLSAGCVSVAHACFGMPHAPNYNGVLSMCCCCRRRRRRRWRRVRVWVSVELNFEIVLTLVRARKRITRTHQSELCILAARMNAHS